MPNDIRQAKAKQLNQLIRTNNDELKDAVEATRRKFEVTDKNIDQILLRMNRNRWAVSESSGSYDSGNVSGPNGYTRVPGLKVKLNVSGNNPVILGLLQYSERSYNGGITVGGIRIMSLTPPGPLFYAFVGNFTQNKIVHGTIISPQVYESVSITDDRDFFYSPSQVLCVDLFPSPGVNEWEFLYDVDTGSAGPQRVQIQDCQLFAMETGV